MTFKEKLKQKIGDYEPHNDGMIEECAKDIIDLVIDTISTHTEHEGGYCDTGEDMEWSCRSECMDFAVKRLNE